MAASAGLETDPILEFLARKPTKLTAYPSVDSNPTRSTLCYTIESHRKFDAQYNDLSDLNFLAICLKYIF